MARTGSPRVIAFAAIFGLGLAGVGEAVVDVSGPPSGIAVAPFAASHPSGSSSDGARVASVLAAVLGSGSELRVVAPEEVRRDARGVGDPGAEDVRRWARWNRVENVVVGRADGLDVAVELRSGHSGGALAEYRLSPSSHAAMPGAVRELARLILADLGESTAALEDPLPPVAAPGEPGPRAEAPVSSAADGAVAEDEGSMALLPGSQRDAPISINSEELEVVPEGGGRRLVFSRNVEVLQGDVTLEADRLEAVYPQGSSQPDRLHATGHVRVHQGERRARCDEATYERVANTIVCRGRAEVTEGCDRVRGQEIEFDLVRERVRVTGAASVLIQSEEEDTGACADGTAPASAEGPP